MKWKKELEIFAEYLYWNIYFVQKCKPSCISEFKQKRVTTAEIYFKTFKYFSV